MLALTELQIAQNRGDAVITLLGRAEVAPVPAIYALAYDYVAGVPSFGALRVGEIIAEPGVTPAQERLYEEFIRPYELNGQLDLIVGEMVARLAALDAMLVKRQEISRIQSQSLAAESVRLETAAPRPELMREWVSRLKAVNETAQLANSNLAHELDLAADKVESMRAELAKLSRDSLLDPVTGIANRAGLDSAFAAAIEEVRVGGRTDLALAMIDIDHFKRFNDTYGHQAGDTVLQIVARGLLASVRGGDIVGRAGGDEFVVVLRDIREGSGSSVAEAMRGAVADADMSSVLGRDVLGGLTVSIGVAHYRDGDAMATLLGRADKCLFEAKRAGRNRVVMDEPPPATEVAAA